MENELRYYLKLIKASMQETSDGEVFKPTYIVTATQLPTGAVELAVNNTDIAEKIDYILEAYDESMHLKTNTDVVMLNIMVV